jgi:hypothetical protein
MQQSEGRRVSIPDNLNNFRLIGDNDDANREIRLKLRRD